MRKHVHFLAASLAGILMLGSTAFASGEIPRAQFVKRVILKSGIAVEEGATDSGFSDVDAEDAPYIKVAKEKNIVSGFKDGRFRPQEFLTKEQAITIVLAANDLTDMAEDLTDEQIEQLLNGNTTVSDWAKPAVAFAVKFGLVDIDTFHGKEFEPETGSVQFEKIKILRASGVFEEEKVNARLRNKDLSKAEEIKITAKKNDMTASEYLKFAAQKAEEQSGYSINGKVELDRTVKINRVVEETKHAATVEGFVKTPNETYMKADEEVWLEAINVPIAYGFSKALDKDYVIKDEDMFYPDLGRPIRVMTNEVMTTGDKMYIKSDSVQAWTEIPARKVDVIQGAQQGSADIISADKIGRLQPYASFGEDTDTHILVNVTVDSEAYKKISNNNENFLADYILASSELPDDGYTDEDKTAMNNLHNMLSNSMKLDLKFTYCINKETGLFDKVDYTIALNVTAKLKIDEEEADISIASTGKGSVRISDYGRRK